MHPEITGSNVGAQIILTKMSVFKRELVDNGETLRGGISPLEKVFEKIMINYKLIVALIDSGKSVLVSDTLYKQLGEPSQIRTCNIYIKKLPLTDNCL